MRVLDSLRRSFRNLRHAKLRTILTMLAISVGAFALMVALAAGEGARQFVDRLVTSNFDPSSMYVFKVDTSNQDNPFADEAPQEYKGGESQSAKTEQPVLTKEDITQIGATKNIDRVVPLADPSVEYVTAQNAKKYQTSVKSIDEGVQYEALAGSIPPTLQGKQAILPEMLVQVLGFASAQAAVGQEITVQYSPGVTDSLPSQTYQVVAVAKKPSGLLGGAREIVLAQKTVEKLYEMQVGTAVVSYPNAIAYVHNNSQEHLLATKLSLKEEGFESLSAKEFAEQVTQAVNIVQYFVAGFGIIALVVSIFGIINTQLISVLTRTRQIGLMKALGMSGIGVLRLFTFEAMLIGFGGAVLGILVAYVVSIFLNPFLNDKLDLGGNLLVFLPWHTATLTGILILIAAIAGLLPAWKAARLHPVEALRTE